MGRPTSKINNMEYPELWKGLRSHHVDQFKIRLRPACNLVGFYFFPLGWNWREIKALTREDRMPYERKLRNAVFKDFPIPIPKSRKAKIFRKRAMKFRLDHAKALLQKLIQKRTIKYFSGESFNTRFSGAPRRPLDRPINDHDLDALNLLHSSVGHNQRQSRIFVDAEDLINHFIEITETRGNKKVYDSASVTLWCRQQFECDNGMMLEEANTKAELLKTALDWAAEKSDGNNMINDDQVRPIINDLCKEYGFEK